MKNVILISKDCQLVDYYPTYGNTYWKTPNIDELARKGTIFRKHYTAAPSTAMAFTSMFTGLYPYQLERAIYEEVENFEQGTTLFDEMYNRGYECHLIWSNNYIHMAEKFSKCYGKHTIHHENKKMNQSVGVHIPRNEERNSINRDDDKVDDIIRYLLNEIDSIKQDRPLFLWIHLPHVILGRCGYGQDIDVFDEFIGEIRKRFNDDEIYITADHGNMNGVKGKTCYGFDVYEPAIHIPLITPRIDQYSEIDFPTSNIQLMQIILENKIEKNRYIVCDTQYYAQPYRKTAIISDKYKYIYNKLTRKEELYDLEYDPNENINLLEKLLYDQDRKRKVNAEQVIFYPYRECADLAYVDMKAYLMSFWREASKPIEIKNYLHWKLSSYKAALKRILSK